MKTLHTTDFVLDWVYTDAFENPSSLAEETHAFWASWFAGFSEMDHKVPRTIAAEAVIVTQWTFAGANNGPLGPLAFGERMGSSGRTIQSRADIGVCSLFRSAV